MRVVIGCYEILIQCEFLLLLLGQKWIEPLQNFMKIDKPNSNIFPDDIKRQI